MDGRNLESNFGLQDHFPWLHQLLRHANGGAIAGNEASGIFGDSKKERRSAGLDGKDPSDRKGIANPAILAKTSKDICQFDV